MKTKTELLNEEQSLQKEVQELQKSVEFTNGVMLKAPLLLVFLMVFATSVIIPVFYYLGAGLRYLLLIPVR